ncbi:hypothetical protein [Pseudomonas putida]|uniref:hypothetical protein n=1 Tax=Pseudomonas putida TaxID=303 RepID=UPI0015DCD2BF|nr:hypothetical protein [Pseudomonas putida]BBR53533.1 hypothetical protein WP4W18C03_18600 [Pseudomonas putida]
MRYNTGNPVGTDGSSDPRDLYDNSGVIDVFATDRTKRSTPDRLGVERRTIYGMDQDFIEFLGRQGYESVFLAYDAGVIIERQTQLVQRDGELYRAVDVSDLPLTLTGTWATDSANLLAVGDAALRQALAQPDGMNMVGAIEGVVGDFLPSRVHIRKFGVKSDGVADDSDALETAILAGVPLNFGSGTIRITRRLGGLVPGAIDWTANGATIFNAATAETPACIDLEALPNLDHRIVGVLKINGDFLSSVGIRVWNKSTAGFPLGYSSFYSSDMQVQNIRRGSINSANGDGIIVRGGWSSVVFDRPVVKNVLLAAGAGILGSVGVTGITVFGDSSGYPIMTTINDATIDTIRSEDPAYNYDQDGVRIFGPWGTAGGKTNSSFIIRGGTFRECWGRSVKSQAETGVITGTNFAAFSGPTGGRNSEIDFQIGGGMVSNITCYYSGANAVPAEVVSFQPSPDFEAFAGTVRGIQVSTTHAMPAVVSTYPRAKTQHKITVRDIDVIGPISRLVEFRVWSDKTRLLVDGCTVNNVSGQLVRVTSSGAGGSPYVGQVVIKNATNLGSVVPLVTDKVSGLVANSVVSSQAVDGFTIPAAQAESGASMGGALRINSIIGLDSSSGAFEPMSKTIAAGATVTFPIRGYNNSAAAIVSISTPGNVSHAMVSISTSQVLLLTAGSTDIVGGTTSEPGSGNFRMWISGGLLQVKNNTASSRQCTLFYMG